MEEEKVPTSDLSEDLPWEDESTVSESQKKRIQIDFSSGVKPKSLGIDDAIIWNKKYDQLSHKEKILLETQEQTRLIRRILSNILFYFWLTMGCIGLYIVVVYLVV